LAEWLGRGLQSLVQRFESARRLYSSGFELARPGETDTVPNRLSGQSSGCIRLEDFFETPSQFFCRSDFVEEPSGEARVAALANHGEQDVLGSDDPMTRLRGDL
jgi:hypothetical protein